MFIAAAALSALAGMAAIAAVDVNRESETSEAEITLFIWLSLLGFVEGCGEIGNSQIHRLFCLQHDLAHAEELVGDAVEHLRIHSHARILELRRVGLPVGP
ncbi:hypothetical protein D3C87_1819650 [compost metagenome]